MDHGKDKEHCPTWFFMGCPLAEDISHGIKDHCSTYFQPFMRMVIEYVLLGTSSHCNLGQGADRCGAQEDYGLPQAT